uniref:Sialate O-acetylesterase domain-containing protein n=1 Tax=Oryza rufipogon TaxID=4529 RepID=A0A0E0NYZ7_ORYRU
MAAATWCGADPPKPSPPLWGVARSRALSHSLPFPSLPPFLWRPVRSGVAGATGDPGRDRDGAGQVHRAGEGGPEGGAWLKYVDAKGLPMANDYTHLTTPTQIKLDKMLAKAMTLRRCRRRR